MLGIQMIMATAIQLNGENVNKLTCSRQLRQPDKKKKNERAGILHLLVT